MTRHASAGRLTHAELWAVRTCPEIQEQDLPWSLWPWNSGQQGVQTHHGCGFEMKGEKGGGDVALACIPVDCVTVHARFPSVLLIRVAPGCSRLSHLALSGGFELCSLAVFEGIGSCPRVSLNPKTRRLLVKSQRGLSVMLYSGSMATDDVWADDIHDEHGEDFGPNAADLARDWETRRSRFWNVSVFQPSPPGLALCATGGFPSCSGRPFMRCLPPPASRADHCARVQDGYREGLEEGKVKFIKDGFFSGTHLATACNFLLLGVVLAGPIAVT